MKIQLEILYVGTLTFHSGLAQVQRQLLMAKGLVELNCSILVLCRYGINQLEKKITINSIGKFEGVNYTYCSGNPYRTSKFVKRNYLKLRGFIRELIIIASFKKNITTQSISKDKVIIISANSFTNVIYYSLLAKLFRITSIIDTVEYWSSHKKGLKKKIDSFFYDRFYFYLTDKIIVISDFLYQKVKEKQPNKPLIKIPVICDFLKFNNSEINNMIKSPRPYFLFCGTSVYYEVIFFILQAYLKLKIEIDLVLITGGYERHLDRIKKYIRENNIKNIILKTNIPYNELIVLYKNSLALLIPLRATIQDIARFPHKIGEYTASARPIVSTKIGEIPNYFIDGYNAYLSDTYDISLFALKMQQLIDDPELSTKIGLHSYKTGLQNFDYRKHTVRLYDFILH
jgi:glycosyltransferase involved in cell wall biosynthesis